LKIETEDLESNSTKFNNYLAFMENVIISNPKDFDNKKKLFKESGLGDLHIVSDFDRTLTKAFIHGKKSNTSFAQLREGDYLPIEYQEKANLLFQKYRPIEIDTKLSKEQKTIEMIDWWNAHLSLFVEYGLKSKDIKDVISKWKVIGRPNLKEFFSFLDSNNVPLVIISSGLGNLAEEFLKQESINFEDIYLVSNMLEFDSSGKAIGYNELVITPFNKNEQQIIKTSFFERIKDKKSILLLGDILEDIDMLEGSEYNQTIKIGFLNPRVDLQLEKAGTNKETFEEELEGYKKAFDVVILNDGSLSFVNELLKEIYSEIL